MTDLRALLQSLECASNDECTATRFDLDQNQILGARFKSQRRNGLQALSLTLWRQTPRFGNQAYRLVDIKFNNAVLDSPEAEIIHFEIGGCPHGPPSLGECIRHLATSITMLRKGALPLLPIASPFKTPPSWTGLFFEGSAQ